MSAPTPRKLPWTSHPNSAGKGGANRGADGNKRPSSTASYAQGSSQNPISIESPPDSSNEASSSVGGSKKRRKTTKHKPVVAPRPITGLHANGLHPTDFSAEYFSADDFEGDDALAQEVVDLTQSEDKDESVLVGSFKCAAVGVRYYAGVATVGEQVTLQREPHNKVNVCGL